MKYQVKEPWAQQEDESPNAFADFQHFRDLGPSRTVAGAARDLGKSKQYLSKLAKDYDWKQRAIAYDAEQDRVRRQAAMDQVEKMAARHASQAQAQARVLLEPALYLVKRLQDQEYKMKFYEKVDELEIDKIMRMLSQASAAWEKLFKAERLARGESTDRAEKKISIEVVQRVSLAIGQLALEYVPEDRQTQFREDLKQLMSSEEFRTRTIENGA